MCAFIYVFALRFLCRSYLGIMVLWLNHRTLERKVAALARQRMQGRVTYETLASSLKGVFSEDDLQGKVANVITDKRLNFVKVFQ